MHNIILDSTYSKPKLVTDDIKIGKVAYDTDFFTRVKDIFQKRKKREIDLYDANDGEKVSFFDYIKDSTAGKCDASGAQRVNKIIKKRRKRNILSTQRKRFSSEFVREKRRAEQEMLELQHQYMRCNRNARPDTKECRGIYLRFQKLVKEINEKFHQFNDDNFEHLNTMRSESEMIKRQELETNEVEPSIKKGPVPNLQKNNENVGQTFFGDGFYSYSYDQIPKFHEDLHDSQQRNLKTMSRDETLPFQNQGRPDTLTNSENQAKNIPVKVPEPIGKMKRTF